MSRALIALAVLATASVVISEESKEDPEKYLMRIDKEYNEVSHKYMLAVWNSGINLSDETLEEEVANATTELGNWQKKMYEKLKTYEWKKLEDENLKRQFFKFSQTAEAALPEEVSYTLRITNPGLKVGFEKCVAYEEGNYQTPNYQF